MKILKSEYNRRKCCCSIRLP